jgi:hypothetical protein
VNNYEVFRVAAEIMPDKVMPKTPEELAEFARIVAAGEREACAKACDQLSWKLNDDITKAAFTMAADTIRAIGAK